MSGCYGDGDHVTTFVAGLIWPGEVPGFVSSLPDLFLIHLGLAPGAQVSCGFWFITVTTCVTIFLSWRHPLRHCPCTRWPLAGSPLHHYVTFSPPPPRRLLQLLLCSYCYQDDQGMCNLLTFGLHIKPSGSLLPRLFIVTLNKEVITFLFLTPMFWSSLPLSSSLKHYCYWLTLSISTRIFIKEVLYYTPTYLACFYQGFGLMTVLFLAFSTRETHLSTSKYPFPNNHLYFAASYHL